MKIIKNCNLIKMIGIKKIFLFLLIFTFQETFAQDLSKKEKKSIARIESYLSKEFPANEPGAIILIAKKGVIIYKKPFGLSNLETKEILDLKDVLPIASMTKQFTAVSILKLAEENKLSLTDSIQKYIPEFPSKKYKITIENLLAQTSGIREYFDVDESDYHILTKEHHPLQIIEYFKDDPLEFEPNTQFQYSNSNYFLLGFIIERVSGKPYGEFLEKIIFSPLNMLQSSYWYDINKSITKQPIGYQYVNGNFKPSIAVDGSIWYSCGGITSTVEDLYNWNTSIFHDILLNSNELLKNSTILKNGQSTGYSFGFFIKDLQGSTTFQHGGNLYGFSSSGLYLPKDDIYVAILSNRGFKPTEDIANYLGSEILGKPIKPSIGVFIDNIQLEKYAGTYQLSSDKNRLMKILIVADRLVLSFPEQKGAEVDILPMGNHKFESKKVNAALEFFMDDGGNIKSLIVDQKGKTEWIKIPE
ncbi:serine hydrolase [Algoriphagus sp. D3-2-R+10]|uniref:serine hydrolase n=1 Tax=Algoriphagus aurantiacus TaxID=3103948 RepID=UPI002B3A3D1E|nr:serine hydrolase [Algoriphagus sp. D3-2-R+10]MEB2778647.1 serine hydrolase [Algoriphagus sp. D3-2-R+10]